ncbi:hypothetical protein ACQRIT_006127 [Beauveria bassiana]
MQKTPHQHKDITTSTIAPAAKFDLHNQAACPYPTPVPLITASSACIPACAPDSTTRVTGNPASRLQSIQIAMARDCLQGINTASSGLG